MECEKRAKKDAAVWEWDVGEAIVKKNGGKVVSLFCYYCLF